MCESISYLVGGKMTDVESGSDFSLYASECNAVQLKCKELALDTINNCIELLGTRAFAPNSRVIFDNLMNVYATCAMSGSSDVLSLQLAQSGIQYRYHFDNQYFLKNRGSDWRDGAFRQRTWMKWRDSRDEFNNFTDQWKSTKGLGVKDSYLQGIAVTMVRETLGAKMWGRLITNKKLTGLLGGRWNAHVETSGSPGPGSYGWLQGMLHQDFHELVTDVDDFGRRLYMLMSMHGEELEGLQLPMKRTADSAVNIFTMAATLSRANKTCRLGYNFYEDEVGLAHQIFRRYKFENRIRFHEMMPWNMKSALVDKNTEHIAKQVIASGKYHFQPAIALGFNFEDNVAYLDKLDELRTLGGGFAGVEPRNKNKSETTNSVVDSLTESIVKNSETENTVPENTGPEKTSPEKRKASD